MIIKNHQRYLTPKIIEQCFQQGKFLSVDKQVCGNGFSTSFIKLPVKDGFKNIIIAPNKAFLLEKEQTYKNNPSLFENRIKFFYKESKEIDFTNADVLCFVADSFLRMKYKVSNVNIDKVLIDEVHSVEQQSSFRYKLIDFESKVLSLCPDGSIVKVTASPTLYSKPDITINNVLIAPQTIIVTKDRIEAIERIKNDIKSGLNVVVFSNNVNVFYKLRDYKKQLKARFVVGVTLERSISRLAHIKNDIDSKLTLVSSRGFEGFDIDYKDASVYYFEDRGFAFESFYISNLYQAISRTRKGAKYIEYCRQELSNKRVDNFEDIDIEVDAFINDKNESIESKQREKNKRFKPYVIFNQDANGVFSIAKNQTGVNLYKEKRIFDKPFLQKEFIEFAEQRKLTFKIDDSINNRIRVCVKRADRIKNLYVNRDYIEELGLFGDDYTLQVIDLNNHSKKDIEDRRQSYLKYLDNFFIDKNYKQDYELTEREDIAFDLLNDALKFKKLVADVTKAYDSRSIKKYGLKDSEAHRNEFKIKSSNTVGMLILMFAKNTISVPQKWVANRNYNLLTTIGIDEINLVGSVFGVNVLELDIRNCFVRVLYGINGLSLPSIFYGADKKNKEAINIFLNNFFYNPKIKTPKKIQKVRAIEKFRKLGFNEKVIYYLIDKYFLTDYRGQLFSDLAFYEKNIINEILDVVNIDNDGVIRRHDSLIIFNNRVDLSFLNEFVFSRFPNIKGWFNVAGSKVIQLQDGDTFYSEMSLKEIFANRSKKVTNKC